MFAFTKILNIVVRRCQWFLLAGMFFSHHLNHLKQRCRRCSWVKQRSSLLVCMPLGIRSRALSQYSLKRHLDKLCVLYYFTFFNFLFTILSILTFWWQHSMQYLGCLTLSLPRTPGQSFKYIPLLLRTSWARPY